MIKLYEDFVNFDKLYDIIKQLENRVKYWFDEGTLGVDTNLTQIDSTLTNKYSDRRIFVTFSNESYMYQLILTVKSENGDKCNILLKRYDLSTNDFIDQIEDSVNINDIKEDNIILKMSELDDKSNNPDKIKIDTGEKDKDEKDKDEKDKDKSNEDEFEDIPFELGGNNEGEEIQGQDEF